MSEEALMIAVYYSAHLPYGVQPRSLRVRLDANCS